MYVPDACAIIALVRGEPGGDLVRVILGDARHACHAHAFNLCEVLLDHSRVAGDVAAADEAAALEGAGLIARGDMDAAFRCTVAQVKRQRGLPWGDCFCIALGARLGATVLTSDHGDFEAVATSGLCAVQFIR